MKRSELTQSGIYEIRSPSGKYYVGSAVNIGKRWREHQSQLRVAKHHCRGLQRAADKYGLTALRFTVLELCSRDELIKREQYHMDLAPKGRLYNSAPFAGHCLGVPCSEEKKRLISRARKGRKATPEQRQRMREAHLGFVMPEATKQKLRAAHLGHKRMTPEVREKIGAKSGKSTTGHRNVHFDRARNCWAVKVNNGNAIGRFPTIEEAIAARDKFLADPSSFVPVSAKFTPSGFPGVSWHKGKQRWSAFVGSGKTLKTLGMFDTPEAAAAGRQRYLDDPASYVAPNNNKPAAIHPGVNWDGRDKWMVYAPGRKYLGRYKTLDEAVAARQAYLAQIV